MPELPEVEAFRELAESALNRRIASVRLHDPRYLRGGASPPDLRRALAGASLGAARRIGKLLVLDVAGAGAGAGRAAPGRRLGLHFGMTGRLVVDGDVGTVEALIYAPSRLEPAWDRFSVRFEDGGRLVVNDPRRLGGVTLDPDEDRLGPDALAVTARQLAAALAGSAVALKARLLDQTRVAGIGNLVGDELLWRAGLSPLRRSGSLDHDEVRLLHRQLRRTLALLIERGGSHLGDLVPQRRPGGHCPRDRAPLRQSRVGGRTSWWCALHQH